MRSTHRHERLLAVAVVVLTVAAAGAGYRIEAHKATPVPLPKALAEFRATSTTTSTTTAIASATTALARSASATVVERTQPAAGGPDRRPAPGVYSYRTSGSEHLSIPGTERSYPAHTYATVRRGDGCAFRIDHPLLEEHVDRFGRCADAAALRVVSDESDVSFFGQHDSGAYRCDPPVIQALWGDGSAVTRETCRDTNGSADYVFTGRGDEEIVIAGRGMTARHVRFDARLHGRADGVVTVDTWFDPATSMVLRMTRDVDTDGHSAFGDIHYTEHLELALESLTPRT